MPELPEVETIVRDLARSGIVGTRIRRVRVFWPRIIEGESARSFTRRLTGRRIECIRRRGKYIVIGLSGELSLLIHLRMTGSFSVTDSPSRRAPHEHVLIDLEGGYQLRYRDTRKFGRWRIVAEPDRALQHLGPEPLDQRFTLRVFRAALRRRRATLKPLLLNQQFVAGLGNIYVDEALWQARLHPRRLGDTLKPGEEARLYRSIRSVLRKGIRCMGTSLGNGRPNFLRPTGARGGHQEKLNVFRRTGKPCPRCGTPVQRLIVSQRSTHVCSECQADPGTRKAAKSLPSRRHGRRKRKTGRA